jgi:hypothetical protein
LRVVVKQVEIEHGFFEACFDLGLFKGTAALAMREESLSVWCYIEQRKKVPNVDKEEYDKAEHDNDMKSLKRVSSAAWHAIGIMKEGRYVLPDLETDISTPPSFFGEFRCEDCAAKRSPVAIVRYGKDTLWRILEDIMNLLCHADSKMSRELKHAAYSSKLCRKKGLLPWCKSSVDLVAYLGLQIRTRPVTDPAS